jgi:hypothetical protein
MTLSALGRSGNSGYRPGMHKGSVAVTLVAAGALVAGSIGMADAETSSSEASRSAHSAHSAGFVDGSIGENRSLAPKRTLGRLPKLVGVVKGYRTFEISDRTPNPGRYRIVVRDTANRHNWHLYGNGKSVKTVVRQTGRWVFKIRLTRGTYRVVCDPHNDEMEFNVVVG